MLKFEIIQSPDTNVKSSFNLMSNVLYIGRKNGELIIADPALKETHIMLEVIGKDLLLHPQREVEFFLINGKRATSVRKLKTGDELSIGNTVIKIGHFEETEVESKKTVLNKKLAALVDSNSSRLPVIDQLSKMSK